MKSTLALIVSVVALIIGVGGYMYPQFVTTQPIVTEEEQFGAATPGTRFPHGITIGLPASSPTNVSKILTGSCNMIGADASVTASSTSSFDCAIPGVISTDRVVAMLSTTTNVANSPLNWNIMSAKASTTAGFVTFRLTNLSGANAVPSATAVGSSTSYIVIATQ